jgi:hypothetical protein
MQLDGNDEAMLCFGLCPSIFAALEPRFEEEKTLIIIV